MIVRLALEGKVKDKNVGAFVSEYRKRLSPFFKMELAELGSGKGFEKLLKTSSKNDVFIALDSSGKRFDSAGFAGWFREKRDTGRDMTFVIGEAGGLSETARFAASEYISLSDMTFSYRVSLMVLSEQIYRAMTIITGHPYHK